MKVHKLFILFSSFLQSIEKIQLDLRLLGSTFKRKKDDEDEAEDEKQDKYFSLKKSYVVWSVQLHQHFVVVVNQLGIDSKISFSPNFSIQSPWFYFF